jgi:hypothetical protein
VKNKYEFLLVIMKIKYLTFSGQATGQADIVLQKTSVKLVDKTQITDRTQGKHP